ncbi:MAG: histidine--tRNA ligase [Ignavibacteria bacterium]|nr:histidine--tRNA ligase [Ignavibacteria bacterium]
MIQAVRGTKDILPTDIGAWQALEATFRRIAGQFGFQELRTPVFEHTELFSRGIGETTDIVGKEMYTFLDQGQTSLTLRPEATASIVRAVIENTLVEKNPLLRLWYMGAMFRQERPQKGRLRQFHQFDAEILGSAQPEADAESLLLAYTILRAIGLTAFELRLNSLGNTESRLRYREALQAYFRPHISGMSADSQHRLEKNPLRILDSKHPEDADAVKGAPLLTEYLDDASQRYFESVQKILVALEIPYIADARLVRGLDYYCHTTFEFVTTRLGSQNAIGGGGRYDGLFEQFGGKPTPGIGFAFGIERLLLLLEEEQKTPTSDTQCDLYVIALDDESSPLGMKLAQALRLRGLTVITDALRRSFKAQMRDADRTKARFVAIIGEKERLSQSAIIKNMATGEQHEMALEDTGTLYQVISGTEKTHIDIR